MARSDTANEETLLHQMVKIIIQEVSPEVIILFGSRARDDVRPDSDIDLLIGETESFSAQHSRRKEVAHLYIALKGLNVFKDILLYSREESDH